MRYGIEGYGIGGYEDIRDIRYKRYGIGGYGIGGYEGMRDIRYIRDI